MGIASSDWREKKLTEQFYAWELRGRGWKVFPEPISLEPPFRPFHGHFLPPEKRIDDGRQHTFVSGLLARLSKSAPDPKEEPPDAEEEPEPDRREAEEPVELQMSLPLSRSVPPPQVESFLRHVCRPGETLALEILGTERETVPQFVASPRTAMRVERAVGASFPGVVATPSREALFEAWKDSEANFAVVELGLGSEFMLPLGDPRSDLLSAVVTAMDGLGKKELALFQVIVEPATHSWTDSITRAVTDAEGAPFFANRPELVRSAQQKVSSPLFGVVIRLVATAADMERAWEIITDIASPLSALARQGTNYLIPLHNDEYSAEAHEEDILTRQSRRSGMLLNLEELTHFLTLPTAVVSTKLRRETAKSRPAPEKVTRDGTIVLGVNVHAGAANEVRLTPEQRTRHCHIIGASGTGKSTLLFNLIRQDIENGQGVAVLDPHGDLVDKILGIIPPERIGDVVLIDPSDEEYSVGFNILAAHSDFEKSLLASDLVSVFQRLSTSWGDQMNSVLRNAILAFLESTEGGTLADLRRFLLDTPFRNRFLATVTDPEIVYYWQKAFPQLSGNKSIGPVVTRLDEFLSRKPIRYMVSQKENRVNFADVIDGGRILLAKLPQGLIGRENSHLLGSLLLSKLQQMAMSRQRMRESERRDFWCYVDEFHSFITPSMAEILTGARKYRVGLTLAHQELRQLQSSDEVASAVLANAFTRVVFRVGDADARSLENGFSHFEARDLQNLEIGEAVCRIERSDFDFNLAVQMPEPSTGNEERRSEEVIAASRATYARSRADIEAEVLKRFREEAPALPPVRKPKHAEQSTPPAEQKATEPTSEAPPANVETISEKEPEVTELSPPSTPSVPRVPGDLGRGGAQHQAIQLKIKTAAEEVGFRVKVEETVLDGAGCVDLVLEREGVAIACEINVTSTIDQEVGNVGKCLKAGFQQIAVISPRADRLSRLEEAVKGCFAPEQIAKVRFYSPDDFISLIQLPADPVSKAPTASIPTETRRRGYKVRRHLVEVSEEDAKARDQVAIKALAEQLRIQHAR